MNRWLPDVSVLIAIIDPEHVFHRTSFDWLRSLGSDEWLTCPLTENGAVRIVSSPAYSAGPVSILRATQSLATLRRVGSHLFVGDTVSITDDRHFAVERIASSRRLTDAYLVALAAANDAVFVTLDSRLVKDGVAAAGAEVMYLDGGQA